jgi:hypothetical protein
MSPAWFRRLWKWRSKKRSTTWVMDIPLPTLFAIKRLEFSNIRLAALIRVLRTNVAQREFVNSFYIYENGIE